MYPGICGKNCGDIGGGVTNEDGAVTKEGDGVIKEGGGSNGNATAAEAACFFAAAFSAVSRALGGGDLLGGAD